MGGWRDATRAATRPSPISSGPARTSLRPQLLPLSVPERLDLRLHVDREAALRAACALSNVFIFIFITYMYVPSSYCCRRVINVQRVTCVANDEHRLAQVLRDRAELVRERGKGRTRATDGGAPCTPSRQMRRGSDSFLP